MSRFILYVAMTFITAFIGTFWAARGFPVRFPSLVTVADVQPTLTRTFRDNGGQTERDRLVEEQLRSPENAKRDPLRADALQAATGFALSPCDKTMKANLVTAALAYARPFHEMLKCNRFLADCSPVIDKAAAAYSTPFDLRVKQALHEAFEKGGISKADFPPELQVEVLSLASSPGSSVSACDRSAERDRP
jgi:hypothetical protein